MRKRELLNNDGKTPRFWTIFLKSNSHTVSYGSVGKAGRSATKLFETKTEAKASYEKLIESKFKKGYFDASPKKKRKSRVQTTHDFNDAIDFSLEHFEDPKEMRMNSRNLFTLRQANKMRKKHPGVPEEFIDYLRVIGYGSFRECQFKVFGFLATSKDIFGDSYSELEEPDVPVLCFGDNFSGDLSVFLPTEDWTVAELWNFGGRLHRTKQHYAEYIREQMLIGPDGKDLRI